MHVYSSPASGQALCGDRLTIHSPSSSGALSQGDTHAGGGVLKGHGCPGQSIMGAAMANVEMARVDGSMSTFLMVHNSLCMLTIGAPCGSCT